MHELCGVRAHVAEALHNHAAALAREAEFFDGLVADHHHATASGLAASAGAADVDGLSGHTSRHGLAHVHGVGVHHPGHDLFVGVDVGSGNVFFGPDEFDKFGSVAAGHWLSFTPWHSCRMPDSPPPSPPARTYYHSPPPRSPTRPDPALHHYDPMRA